MTLRIGLSAAPIPEARRTLVNKIPIKLIAANTRFKMPRTVTATGRRIGYHLSEKAKGWVRRAIVGGALSCRIRQPLPTLAQFAASDTRLRAFTGRPHERAAANVVAPGAYRTRHRRRGFRPVPRPASGPR